MKMNKIEAGVWPIIMVTILIWTFLVMPRVIINLTVPVMIIDTTQITIVDGLIKLMFSDCLLVVVVAQLKKQLLPKPEMYSWIQPWAIFIQYSLILNYVEYQNGPLNIFVRKKEKNYSIIFKGLFYGQGFFNCLFSLKKLGHSRPLFLYFCLSYCVYLIQLMVNNIADARISCVNIGVPP